MIILPGERHMDRRKAMREKGRINRGWLQLAAVLLSVLFMAVGCGTVHKEKSAPSEQDERLNVVTTVFPYYDFLRQTAGDRIQLTLVVPAGMDSHSFEPTPADIITIQNADLLVCNGGAMEQWLTRVLDSLEGGQEPGCVVRMMDYVDTVQEEIVEGMEDEEHHHDGEEEHDEDGEENHVHEIEYDEHIWTSPVNAMKLTEVLSETLSGLDPDGRSVYSENAAVYVEKLSKLDREFRDIVASGKRRLIVFGDKFPLRYFFEEYGLDYRAAFSGCSTDTEPSAKTIAYLIDKVREENIPAVYYLELSSPRVAEIISEETGAEPLLFHSCHNVTRKQFEQGITYLEMMEQNAVNLRKGLE